MSMSSRSVFTTLLKKFSGVDRINRVSILDPLLSASEINLLITEAGRVEKPRGITQNRFAQFGEQESTVIGSGLDFAGRRAYVAGDDPRFIDWRASARSQQTLLRNYYSELSSPGCIVIDRRPGMAFGTRKRLKVTQAVRVGITLGTSLLRGGYQLACLLLDNPDYWQPAQSSMAVFRQTAKKAASACPPDDQRDSTHSWGRISDGLKNRLPKGSRLIMISDFLQLDEAEYKVIQQLCFHYDVTVIQVIDPLEQYLPVLQSVSLHYKNKPSLRLNDPHSSRQLNQLLQFNFEQQADRFKKMECQFIRVHTDDELDVLRGLL